MNTTAANTTTPDVLLPRPLAWVVLLAGPAATMWALTSWMPSTELGSVSSPTALWFLLVLLWSPAFFSIPALLTQHARDRALSSLGGPAWHPGNLVRGVILIPYLLFAKSSPIRVETALSLVGFALAIAWAAPYLFA